MLGAGLEQDQQESAFVEDTGGGGVVGLNRTTGSHLWAQFHILLGDAGAEDAAFSHPAGLQGPFSQQLPAPKCTSLLFVSPPQARWGCGIHCLEGPGLIGLTCVHSEPLA